MHSCDLLDRPIWHSLAIFDPAHVMGSDLARRFAPSTHAFAAAADRDEQSLAALADLAAHGPLALMEADPPRSLPGLECLRHAPILQLVLDRLSPSGRTIAAHELTDADSPDMLRLATLTQPGPFFERTHHMGRFIGVRDDAGQLVAMAGERLRFGGHSEMSALCTHPDHRGKGLAEALMRTIVEGQMARGERPFLHAFPGNPALALYERVGFRIRRTQWLAVFDRPDAVRDPQSFLSR